MNLTDNKNIPFAAYDVAVYIPTGIVTIYSLYAVFLHKGSDVEKFFKVLNYNNFIIGFVAIILFLSLAYMAGHIVSFLSAYLIERYIQNKYSYPSVIWVALEKNPDKLPREVIYNIKEYNKNSDDDKNDDDKNEKSKKKFREIILKYIRKNFFKPIIFVFHLPNIIVTLVFQIIKPANFLIPKIPKGGMPKVQAQIDELKIGKLKIGDSRWEKLIEHYVANNCNSSFKRMYNYLIIYGALRCIALLSISANWFYIYLIFSSSKFDDGGVFIFSNNLRFPDDLQLILAFIIFPAVSWLSLLAFAKFNRRFFEEGILAILTDGKN